MRAECGKLGPIEKVRIFKHNPEGVVTVRFKAIEPAQQCVALMNGRWAGGETGKVGCLVWRFGLQRVKGKAGWAIGRQGERELGGAREAGSYGQVRNPRA